MKTEAIYTPWRRSGLPQMSVEDIAREANPMMLKLGQKP